MPPQILPTEVAEQVSGGGSLHTIFRKEVTMVICHAHIQAG
ncbi:hypothetical protein [Streptomyces violaceusniger]